MAPYRILIVMISSYNKQFHCHFGLKMLYFVYFRFDDIYFRSKWRPVISPKTGSTGKICDGTISQINSHD